MYQNSSLKKLVVRQTTVITHSTTTVITYKPTVIKTSTNQSTYASHSEVVENFTSPDTEEYEQLVKVFGSLPNFITFLCSLILLICFTTVAIFYLCKNCCCPNRSTPRAIRRMRHHLVNAASPMRVFFSSPNQSQNGDIPLSIINPNPASPILRNTQFGNNLYNESYHSALEISNA